MLPITGGITILGPNISGIFSGSVDKDAPKSREVAAFSMFSNARPLYSSTVTISPEGVFTAGVNLSGSLIKLLPIFTPITGAFL